MINLDDILNQVKDVEETKLKNERGGFQVDARILVMKKNCRYVLRLLPNVKDANGTFVTYKEIGWKSPSTGKYVYGGRSPSDAGIKDDLFKSTQWEEFVKARDKGDEVAKKVTYSLLPQRKQMVNAYLVEVEGDDAESKEKIGTVVVFRYAAQIENKTQAPVSDIYKRIHSGIFGDTAKKVGKKALDLGPNGKSLIINVADKAGFNNYADTTFDDSEDLGLSDEKIMEIYNGVYNLNEFLPEVKTKEEIKQLIDTAYFGNSATEEDELLDVELPPSRKSKPAPTDDDELPGIAPGKAGKTSDDLDDLLADL